MKAKTRFFFNVIEEQPFGKAFGYAYVVTRTLIENNEMEIIEKGECYNIEALDHCSEDLKNNFIAHHSVLKQCITLKGIERTDYHMSHENEIAYTYGRLLYQFYETYTDWSKRGAEIWGDNNFPIKTNFLMNVIKDAQLKNMKIPMPHPLHDVADFVDINIDRRIYTGMMDLQTTSLLDTLLASVFAFNKSQTQQAEITDNATNPAKFIDNNHLNIGSEIFKHLDKFTLLGFRMVNKKWNNMATSVLIEHYATETYSMQFFNKIACLKTNIANPGAKLIEQIAVLASLLMQSLLQKTKELVKECKGVKNKIYHAYGFKEAIEFDDKERKLLHNIGLTCEKIAKVTTAISEINAGNYGYKISPKLENFDLKIHLSKLEFSKHVWDFESWILKNITFDFILDKEATIILNRENCENVKLNNQAYYFNDANVLLNDPVENETINVEYLQSRKRKRSQDECEDQLFVNGIKS